MLGVEPGLWSTGRPRAEPREVGEQDSACAQVGAGVCAVAVFSVAQHRRWTACRVPRVHANPSLTLSASLFSEGT